MRALLQRVKKAKVSVEGKTVSEIGTGLLVFLGIETADSFEDVEWLCGKIARLRIFADEAGAMNRNISETMGECLVVSQFTLHAATRKGNRPSFIKAARPEVAVPLYEVFISELEKKVNSEVRTGRFGAMMDVELINDGPVTIFIDSKLRE